MPDHLTAEQIELLRGLPGFGMQTRKLEETEHAVLNEWHGHAFWIYRNDFNSACRDVAADTLLATIDHQRNQIIEEIEGLARRYDTREMSYEAGDPVAQTYKHAAADLRNLANNLKGQSE